MTHSTLKRTRHPVAATLARYAVPAFVVALALTVTLSLTGPAGQDGYAHTPAAEPAGFATDHPVATRIIRPPARFAGTAD